MLTSIQKESQQTSEKMNNRILHFLNEVANVSEKKVQAF